MVPSRTHSTQPAPAPAPAAPAPTSGERSDAQEPGGWTPPEEFDDYVVLRPLGRGGMGHVYLAEDAVLARHVAVKFIGAPEPDAAARQRFLIEARAAGRLQHPNVVSVYRVGELGERPYIISEFARGHSLDRLEAPMEWRRALEIGIDLSRGLAAAHRNGVLHCDIKPQNAIVTDEGPAKLLDFGLARVSPHRADVSDERLTGDGPEERVEGTPDYMAPEVWRGEPPSRRSDVYSLGAVLYELAAGETPFFDVAVAEVAVACQLRDAPSLAARAPACDARFAAIVDRCLRRHAGERFASGDELRAALEELSRGARGPAVLPGNPYRGLRAFEADHRALFFGRGPEIGVLLDRLRTEPFLLVTGESGVGKSSLCKAGVLPAVSEGALASGRRWQVVVVVPGKQPVAALAAALGPRVGMPAAELAADICRDRQALARALARSLGDDEGLVLFVDQMEELLTVADPAERSAAEDVLAVLAAGVPGVRLLSTLRADFLTRFAALPALGEDLSRVLYFLRPMSPERTRDVVVGPAQATGIRFETDEMIDALVQATASEGGGLPLLQFALAELWEARDEASGVIRAAALEAMGGVGGALARHADTLVVTMAAPERVEARRMLMRLVTLDDTRVRRTGVELRALDAAARGALDGLVRGRLLVAHEDESGSAYELAHEVLIRSWTTLRRWLSEAKDARAVRERLAAAAAEWCRIGRSRAALWTSPQLAEIDRFPPEDTSEVEREFLDVSRRSVTRGRWLRRAAAVGLPLALAGAYGGAQLQAHRALGRRVDEQLGAAHGALARAREARDEAARSRARAFAEFDQGRRSPGETTWTAALAAERDAWRAFREASRRLEAGLAQDATRSDARGLLAQTLFDRASLAELSRAHAERDELVDRFRLYDDSGKLAAAWSTPAHLSVRTDAEATHVELLRSTGRPGEVSAWEPSATPAVPVVGLELEPGSYLAVLRADGCATVRVPVLLGRGEDLVIDVALPGVADVPEGYVYVPAGRFLFGSTGDEEARKGFFDTVPQHEVVTGAYLIAIHEVTWGEWIEYLDALPAAERARRTPRFGTAGDVGSLELARRADGWRLTIQPAARGYSVRVGEPLRYQRPDGAEDLRWERLPVTGISGDDARAYAAWLDASGRVPRARLCTEYEWERGARGADGRDFPSGAQLPPAAANYDETHGKEGVGPDEVGAHPGSTSPFGLADMSGNAFEWASASLSDGELVVRGGSYWHDAKTARAVNRTVSMSSLRDATLGVRICATPAAR